ncbi:MAG: hypothetical protein DMF61_04680 [Blastocatellia bacterium AA13]|nr:MAG: hypothetical protein DMF61_04680 [Blastocatellia bacterium AA13]
MPPTPPEEIEMYRDRLWRRTPELRVENSSEAERLIESLGFCGGLVDCRRPGPSLYVAVCGRRDAHMPRNVQKDPESSLTWIIKDEILRRGRCYYAKLLRGRSTFMAPRLIPHFNALFGVGKKQERLTLSPEARAVLKALRKERELATVDLREASGIKERPKLTRAIDELQRAMKVIPSEVVYDPWFTYIWTLAEDRFPQEMAVTVRREVALREVARAYLRGAGMTMLGELTRVTGLSRSDAGLGNHALVSEKFAERIAVGVYRLTGLDESLKMLSGE